MSSKAFFVVCLAVSLMAAIGALVVMHNNFGLTIILFVLAFFVAVLGIADLRDGGEL